MLLKHILLHKYFNCITERSAVLRVPVLYGPVEKLDESAVTVLLVPMLSNRLVANDYEQRYPTHVDDIAGACLRIAESESLGIFHWAGGECLTKYGMAVAMADALNLDASKIVRDSTPSQGASRPFDCRLSCQRLEQLGFSERTPFSPSIKQVLSPWLP